MTLAGHTQTRPLYGILITGATVEAAHTATQTLGNRATPTPRERPKPRATESRTAHSALRKLPGSRPGREESLLVPLKEVLVVEDGRSQIGGGDLRVVGAIPRPKSQLVVHGDRRGVLFLDAKRNGPADLGDGVRCSR